ncbi:hypothetical protein AJ85_01985 [Alkalihalobacillus alcalophilus ATCC 27647 = CGMCC 1.3604]|uniref:Uncharacterized protein n=1 Tax=Alkalihalobacillus alcalophilus ATCC 27647 = CGMCC 1.3604 TaxID=1218173 RepID=A0A4S4K3B5_ALKAL|nr:hypothetical protein AJ85_01985 [Alkalihalobacillus alcalophilus ATCC 27647 = CGMCC 1.3604]
MKKTNKKIIYQKIEEWRKAGNPKKGFRLFIFLK